MVDTENLPNIPNFRCVCRHDQDDIGEIPSLWRSSRPDLINNEDVKKFQDLQIKSIIDCRSKSEYTKANGSKILESVYELVDVKLPYSRGYEPHEKVEQLMSSKQESNIAVEQSPSSTQHSPKHYFINFYSLTYIWTLYNRCSFISKLYTGILLPVHMLFNNVNRHLARCLATGMNPRGISGQYIDIVELSQPSVCAVLKLLTDKNNIPAMINCAYGKDRTGVVVALILACLGTSKEKIIDNYSKSDKCLESIKEHIYKDLVDGIHLDIGFTGSDRQNMVELLEHIDNKYGSVQIYLESIGFSQQEQEMLRENLGKYSE